MGFGLKVSKQKSNIMKTHFENFFPPGLLWAVFLLASAGVSGCFQQLIFGAYNVRSTCGPLWMLHLRSADEINLEPTALFLASDDTSSDGGDSDSDDERSLLAQTADILKDLENGGAANDDHDETRLTYGDSRIFRLYRAPLRGGPQVP